MQADEMETGSPASTSEPLFLRDSSDEDEPNAEPTKAKPETEDCPAIEQPQHQTAPNSQRKAKRDFARVDTFTDDSDDDIVILSTPEKPKSLISRPTKRKASPGTVPATQIPAKFVDFEKGYIGSFYCSGLSLNKGKGYITTGAKVVVERNKTQAEKDQEKADKERNKVKAGGKSTTVIKNGKVIKGGGGPVKQATLSGFSSAKKGTSSTASKPAKKADTVVRFNNARGFEVGRLPAGDASFISPLLDPGMIELVGEVIDAPASLTVGCDILLNLKVYLTRKAFEEAVMVGSKSGTDDGSKAGNFWQQQGETEDEKRMRLRKAALDKLFSKWSQSTFSHSSR
jgi:DNA repair protein RAD5